MSKSTYAAGLLTFPYGRPAVYAAMQQGAPRPHFCSGIAMSSPVSARALLPLGLFLVLFLGTGLWFTWQGHADAFYQLRISQLFAAHQGVINGFGEKLVRRCINLHPAAGVGIEACDFGQWGFGGHGYRFCLKKVFINEAHSSCNNPFSSLVFG